MRNYEYDGHFSSIWKICSMGVDRMYYEKKIAENRELLVNKVKAISPVSRVIYYVCSFLFFLLFDIRTLKYINFTL